ncbi:MAG: response regulator transcription factor, partial [Bacteroidia bacterium]
MNKKILVVEDDVSFANILQGFLTKKQYVVEVAYSYKRAGELWASFDFDMVISDYRLPDGTGLEFMQFIREKGARVPF